MKTLAEIYVGTGATPLGDKGTVHSYIPVYEELLAPYRGRVVNVLEIGLFWGESLRMWEEYFLYGNVLGVDLCDQPLGLADLRPMIAEGTHRIFLFNAVNPQQVEQNFEKTLFDVVIDDASHALSEQLSIYNNFKDRMAPGGIYVIEDIENLDRDRALFENIDPRRKVEIIDRRTLKNRFDDVLVVIRN